MKDRGNTSAGQHARGAGSLREPVTIDTALRDISTLQRLSSRSLITLFTSWSEGHGLQQTEGLGSRTRRFITRRGATRAGHLTTNDGGVERAQFILLPSLDKAISIDRVPSFALLCEAPKATLQLGHGTNAKFNGRPRLTAERRLAETFGRSAATCAWQASWHLMTRFVLCHIAMSPVFGSRPFWLRHATTKRVPGLQFSTLELVLPGNGN